MQVFVYEWVTGGGLLSAPNAALGALATKGETMVRAAAEDFAALADTRVCLLRDHRLPSPCVEGATVVVVGSAAEHDERFQTLCRESDAVLLIAPETGGVLLNTVRKAESIGVKLISPGSEFVAIASDKHRTAERLPAARVPAVEGIVLRLGDRLPSDFTYPAVLKPIDGAGSHDTRLVNSPTDEVPRYSGVRRLEPYVSGVPVSVGVLVGDAQRTPLPPCGQRISSDGRLSYLGGWLPLPAEQAERATRLALAAIAAMPPTCGYVGVDLVLGESTSGQDDRVIEINPRLTTSYAALRTAVEENLAEQMLAATGGTPVKLTPTGKSIEFDADGSIRYASA